MSQTASYSLRSIDSEPDTQCGQPAEETYSHHYNCHHHNCEDYYNYNYNCLLLLLLLLLPPLLLLRRRLLVLLLCVHGLSETLVAVPRVPVKTPAFKST